MSKITPMMQQYRNIKEQYPDCLLFFRLGDFYEMFNEDALIGSRELDIVLTARDAGAGQKAPMCGIPYHALENYLARIIGKGYKVAICEQLEDPKSAKGIVKRDVIRVITPGTLLESSLLKEKNNNYLMAVWRESDVKNKSDAFGIAYTDISTGEFMTTEIKGQDVWERLIDEITRISPSECIFGKNLYDEDIVNLRLLNLVIQTKSKLDNEEYIKKNADTLLMIHFKTASMEALGLKDMPLAAVACGMILDFLQLTQKKTMDYLDSLKIYSTDWFMILDATTRRNLELTSTIRTNEKKGSLLWVLDETKTSMGARLLKEWLNKPLLRSDTINQRLDMVEELIQKQMILSEINDLLKRTYDLERLIGRVCYGNATPRDMLALKNTLILLPEYFRLLSQFKSPLSRVFFDHFDLLEDIYELLDKSIIDDPPISPKDGGFIKDGYNAEVDELRRISTHGKDWLTKLEADEKERSGIKSLKVGFNKVFGYYIEITNSNLSNVPDNYIRKQTLANAERYITAELKEWEDKILNASDKLSNLEYQLFTEIRTEVSSNARRIKEVASVIAHLDCLQSFAEVAIERNYCRPEVNDQSLISIKEGRHPVVEKIIGRENYVPNDALLDNRHQQLIILTGPNMTGKSTYMRQVALIVLLARIGSFVPAESAIIGKTDRIFTRVGASDDLAGGQSTFMVEMSETSNILRHATSDSLVILDEIGRGTSTFDGLSIAWAVAEYLIRPECAAKTLFATHYHELTALADIYPLIKNYSILVKEKGGKIIFLRKIIPGGADKSYGIQVASLAGLPNNVICRAKEILHELENKNSDSELLKKPCDMNQLSLNFPLIEEEESTPHPILTEIKDIDINALTPLEALLKVNEWRKTILND